jgi:hypothetical protein
MTVSKMKNTEVMPVMVRDNQGHAMTVERFHGQVLVTKCGQKRYLSEVKIVFQAEREFDAAIVRLGVFIDRKAQEAHAAVAAHTQRARLEMAQNRRSAAAKHARAAKKSMSSSARAVI